MSSMTREAEDLASAEKAAPLNVDERRQKRPPKTESPIAGIGNFRTLAPKPVRAAVMAVTYLVIFAASLVSSAHLASSLENNEVFIMQSECHPGNSSGEGDTIVVSKPLFVQLTDRHGYQANLDCTLVFKAPEGQSLMFKLNDLEMERSRDCSNDFLLISQITKGDVVLCGSGKRIDSYFSKTDSISLRFVSNRDLMNTMRGFSGHFSPLSKGEACLTNKFRCKNRYCIDPSLECNGVDDCGDESDEKICRERKILVIGGSVGALVFVICMAFLTLWCVSRKKERNDFENGELFEAEKKKKLSKGCRGCWGDLDSNDSNSIDSKEEWKELIFNESQQGQLQLYALPQSQVFPDLDENTRNLEEQCPEFNAIKKLLLATGGVKGFDASLLVGNNLNKHRQMSLHQLCALCLLMDVENKRQTQPDETSCSNQEEVATKSNLIGYTCPNFCKCDETPATSPMAPSNGMFFSSETIDTVSDRNPTVAILSRPPSYYLVNNCVVKEAQLEKNKTEASDNKVALRLHHQGNVSHRPLTLYESGIDLVPTTDDSDKTNTLPLSSKSRPLTLSTIDAERLKQMLMGSTFDGDDDTTTPNTEGPVLSEKLYEKKASSMPRRSILNHNIYCKHKGKRVRILSKTTSSPSPGPQRSMSSSECDDSTKITAKPVPIIYKSPNTNVSIEDSDKLEISDSKIAKAVQTQQKRTGFRSQFSTE